MIVRTYGRRNRGISRTYTDASLNGNVEDPYSHSLSLSQEQEENPQEICDFTFSSQDSTRWTIESENPSQNSLQFLSPIPESVDFGRKSKRLKNGRKKEDTTVSVPVAATTATLMETQEFGEMMEHLDEVNFALDGLRNGQPVRIRRASLLSLLTICGTAQQRRLLRAQGIAKTIVDAILDLSLDDSSSNLAAAALFHILTCDGQDDYLLDSPASIRFLLKLLKLSVYDIPEDKVPAIRHTLLSFRKDAHVAQDTTKRLDLSSAAIIHKVRELLINCKDMKARSGNEDGMSRPELSPRWIALLTMEKASLSTISIEDTTGTVRKSGGNFKERLREMGGLDAVFEIAMSFHSSMEGWLEHQSMQDKDSKDDGYRQCLAVLLRCLKIMENATFLSKENQNHLLGMKRNLASQGSSFSFTKLLISFIKFLSGLSQLRSSPATFCYEMPRNLSNGLGHLPEPPSIEYQKDSSGDVPIRSSRECSSNGWISSERHWDIPESSQLSSSSHFSSLALSSETATRTSETNNCSENTRLNSSTPVKSKDSRMKLNLGKMPHNIIDAKLKNLKHGEDPFAFDEDEPGSETMTSNCLVKMTLSSAPGSCNLTLKSSEGGASINDGNFRNKLNLGKMPYSIADGKFENLEDSQDPFAFDEDEFEPSRWDVLYGKPKVFRKQKISKSLEDGGLSKPVLSQEESSNEDKNRSSQTSCSSAFDEESSNLLDDCLLTSVKVLMNLTNDNTVGCQQIAACGGLETLASLIACHFPSFSSSISPTGGTRDITLFSDSNIELGSQTNDVHLNDQELDFLVAILGLLVNLVEKDGHNRSRLAAASVSLPCLEEGLVAETHRGVIPLLCSIFLANRGTNESTNEGKIQPWDNKEAVLEEEKAAEKMIVEAYAALLLAFLSTESKSIRDTISDCLPDHSLAVLVPVLDRFVAFHLALDMISPETYKTVSEDPRNTSLIGFTYYSRRRREVEIANIGRGNWHSLRNGETTGSVSRGDEDGVCLGSSTETENDALCYRCGGPYPGALSGDRFVRFSIFRDKVSGGQMSVIIFHL
ncbi:hypothetical protein Nepgr_021359 [Nepenthes gracilis]|uniref:WAPL domain-containing protein n=1 Tax=Nepenthes gracilis TaxID=150966 RepID=A0AAD3SWP5_NEPGR|nr:hypothetical protein Nepgr_021359 [Nepenthes gracilis]